MPRLVAAGSLRNMSWNRCWFLFHAMSCCMLGVAGLLGWFQRSNKNQSWRSRSNQKKKALTTVDLYKLDCLQSLLYLLRWSHGRVSPGHWQRPADWEVSSHGLTVKPVKNQGSPNHFSRSLELGWLTNVPTAKLFLFRGMCSYEFHVHAYVQACFVLSNLSTNVNDGDFGWWIAIPWFLNLQLILNMRYCYNGKPLARLTSEAESSLRNEPLYQPPAPGIQCTHWLRWKVASFCALGPTSFGNRFRCQTGFQLAGVCMKETLFIITKSVSYQPPSLW